MKKINRNKKSEKLKHFNTIDFKYYSGFNKFKDKKLKNSFKLLSKIGVTADMLTVTSLIFGLISAVLIVFNLLIAAMFIMIHLVFDFLDGGLARYKNKETLEGMFTDSTSDLVVVVAITAGMTFNIINGALAVIYIFLYIGEYILAFTRNHINVPVKISLRPRLIVFSFLIIYGVFGYNFVSEIVLLCSSGMLINFINNCLVIKKALK